MPTIIVAIIFLLAFWALKYTKFGRFTYSIGSNAEATCLSGININRVTLGIYMVCGMLTAIAGVIESARLGTIQLLAARVMNYWLSAQS